MRQHRRTGAAPQQLPEIAFAERRLANGLQVILHPDSSVPLVHVSVHYRVGSSHERPGLSGFAHLFEHMMFQGSENVPRNAHGRYVDEAGGSWNASTNKDRTNYYETLPAHQLELGLWLEAERMQSLHVTAENFENQRRTVIEEKKQSYDNRPYGKAHLRFDQLAYRNWAYAHPIIGAVEDLESCTLEDARRFHEVHYGPGNAVLIVAGDFQPEEAWEKIETHFNSIPDRTSSQPPDLSEPVQDAPRREIVEDPLASLPALTMGYHMASIGSAQYYTLVVLSLILAAGESSRFYSAFVYDQNWVTSISAGPNQYKGPQLFSMAAQLQSGVDPATVVSALERQLEQLCRQPVSEDELARARNQITTGLIGQSRTVSRIGERLARYAVYFEDTSLINRQLERFLAVTPEDILAASQDTFRPENQTQIVVEPVSRT